LASFLLAAGAGSAWAQRFAGQPRSKKVIAAAVAVIIALGLVYLALLGPLMQSAGSWQLGVKILLSIALIAPLGFCMGMPFPIGLSALAAGADRLGLGHQWLRIGDQRDPGNPARDPLWFQCGDLAGPRLLPGSSGQFS
jgi:hypothetical protein